MGLFLISPVMMLLLATMMWQVLPTRGYSSNWPLGMISLLMLLSLGVYPVLLMGWTSNSKYAVMGGIRGVAQTISYEISLALFLMLLLVYYMVMNIKDHLHYNLLFFMVLPLTIMLWLILLLAETNRTPFDFAEGESELVSGFNIEYSSIGFTMIFLSEYAMIIMFASLTTSMMFSESVFTLKSSTALVTITGVWILIRAAFPRYRYDLLMNNAWKSYLPMALGMLSVLMTWLSFM